ncbi:hypothetical protein CWE08_11090 [Aliidiomarina iranensis]|uniref:HemY N-terminal domain-containing protein n=1 Tax=Aliidiomarina iranensis TaxID=1434071 RepID=A0A432VR90_9GAMM|nr:heme biosynthesis HemY N-terminal domain-containing protein [Aliidiomarina iranensis]RUO18767.1 hypothetical protein CWE08_11090 [Aliidiomarina iranensis]
MIKALFLILIIAAGLILGPLWSGDSGTLILLLGNYSVEMTLVVAAILLVLVLLLLWLLEALVRKLFSGRKLTANWFLRRREQKAQQQFETALTEWLNKNYKLAANAAEKAAPGLKRPQQGFLLAAAAWQALNNHKEQQRLLSLAQSQATDELSVQLATLETTTDSKLALQLSQRLLQAYPKQNNVLRTAATALYKHQHLQSLREILPALHDREILPGARLAEYTRASYRAYFHGVGTNSDKLNDVWRSLSKKLRLTTPVRLAYLDTLIERGFGAIAAKVAARGIHHQVLTASDLLPYDARDWRQTAALRDEIEKQIKAHPQHPNWLLLLAVVAIQEGDSMLAQRAAEKAISIRPDHQAYRVLGEALLANQQKESALLAFQQAANFKQG